MKNQIFPFNIYKNDTNCTHLNMNGGKYKVEDSDVKTFHLEYLKELDNNNQISIVEKIVPTRKFKLFFDFDIKEKIDHLDLLIIEFLYAIEKENYDPKSIICTGINTLGVHIICQNIIVNQIQAFEIFNKLKSLNLGLNKYMDSSVYYTGLRMIWSIKKKQQTYYYPTYIYNEGIHDITKEQIDRNKLLKACSIHTIIDNEYIPGPFNKLKCVQNSETFCNLNKTLQNLNKNYAYTKITKISKYNDYYILFSNSSYCMNIKESHKNAKVYFILKSKKLYQKCFCKCNIIRPSGEMCKDFKSNNINVSYEFDHSVKKSFKESTPLCV